MGDQQEEAEQQGRLLTDRILRNIAAAAQGGEGGGWDSLPVERARAHAAELLLRCRKLNERGSTKAPPLLLLPCRMGDPVWQLVTQVLQRKIETPAQLDHVMTVLNLDGGPSRRFFSTYLAGPAPPFDVQEFFTATLPFMQRLALRMPDLFPNEIPLLLSGHEGVVSLTREQVACLLVHGFFGTMPNTASYAPEYFNDYDIQFIFRRGGNDAFPLCLMHYFMRITSAMPSGKVSYRRKLSSPCVALWAQSHQFMLPVELFGAGRLIEDSPAGLHADFANEFIGGGVLQGGCVQEEILFITCPECLVAMLLCSKMEESVV
eukprot:TRINITY_DN4482_c0_g1_i1.p1 TRINITY_DN4482_c0_g1~~TRINITY_DN4482_c0_g1_i1.p1  ORF type:complete len:319 (-),score=92.93 TRINITY_DN4482_c0_g1_i1:60-1016(-)